MNTTGNVFGFMTGLPTMAGLVLTSVAILLTSDWRLSLTSLLVQYVLVGLALTRFVQAEVAIVKVLVGVLVVAMLYLSSRRSRAVQGSPESEKERARFLGLHLEWGGGPLGLPLRLLVALLVALAVIRFYAEFVLLLPALEANNPAVPSDIAFVAFWLGGMGLMGLVLSGDPLRVAPSLFTILAGFELIYASLEPTLAVVGFWETLTLLAALAFSYLIIVKGLADLPHEKVPQAGSLDEALFTQGRPDEGGADR